jgi:transaldolase
MNAVYDHGIVEGDTVGGHYVDAQRVLDELKSVGIDYDDVVNVLEAEGVEKFEDSWNQLIEAVTEQLEAQK